MFSRLSLLAIVMLVLSFADLCAASEAADGEAKRAAPARYEVRILSREPMRLGVKARLPISGREIAMAVSRPGDVPEILQQGWPALVRKLSVRDGQGRRLGVESVSEAGWRLAKPQAGWIDVSYEVDYGLLASLRWPARREAAYGDEDNFAVLGRSLFVSTPATTAVDVAFDLPKGWQPITAWPGGQQEFAVPTVADLTENLLVLSRIRPTQVQASGFAVSIVALGPWRELDALVASTVQPLLERFVRLMAFEGRHQYLVVLLPGGENGGESFLASFALTVADAPTSANRHAWGTLIGHEIFHYWNGWRLRGEDYAATQWFQEGFTEYVAMRTMLATGAMTPEQFLENLSAKVTAARRLATPMDAPGNSKGAPLYGAGALVALTWDLRVREQTADRKGLDQFLQALWARSRHGALAYGAHDILAALKATSPGDWAAFHRQYISARQPLPLAAELARVGLRIVEGADGRATVEPDPSASAAAQSRWRDFVADPAGGP